MVVETKGREDLDVPLKMARLRQWCDDVNEIQSDTTYDFVYVDEESFEKFKPKTFEDLLVGFREYKEEDLEEETSAKASKALGKIRTQAETNGSAKLAVKDINRVIRKTRLGRKKKSK